MAASHTNDGEERAPAEDITSRVQASLLPSSRGGERRIVAVQSVPLAILTVLALLVVCHTASEILIPVTIAFVLQALFAPLVQLGSRHRVPQWASAGAIVFSLMCAVGAAVYHLAEPAAEWLQEIPRTAYHLETKLEAWKGSVEEVKRATEEVEKLTNMESEAGLAVSVDDGESLMSTMFERASSIAVSTGLVLTLLFLLLAADGAFHRNLVRILQRPKDKRRATLIVTGFQREISEYLRTITIINAFLGLAIGLSMWALGMPSPVLWGVMAALSNYIPYVGVAVGTVIVGLVALLTFETAGQAVLVPLAYAGCSILEGGLVTPAIIGRKLVLSPAAVLLWLVLWGWLWGIAGALLAVPLLMAVKILCEQIPSLAPIGILLSRGDPEEQPDERHRTPSSPLRGGVPVQE